LNHDLAKVKVPLNKEINSLEGHIPKKAPVLQKNTGGNEGEAQPEGIEKTQSTFNLQKDLEKVKIYVPLTKLLKKPTYKAQLSQFMHPSVSSPTHDSLNLQEERQMVVFGPHVEELDPSTAPFYVTLGILDLLFHNCMLDFEATHNLMLLEVMEQLGLQTTRPYKYLYSFNSNGVKCLVMIKDLVVNLA